jgi:hypothetical protein
MVRVSFLLEGNPDPNEMLVGLCCNQNAKYGILCVLAVCSQHRIYQNSAIFSLGPFCAESRKYQKSRS